MIAVISRQGAMQPSESSLLVLILVNLLLLAHSQKCDITLYNAPCGAKIYFEPALSETMSDHLSRITPKHYI